jgi:hypothetical protein
MPIGIKLYEVRLSDKRRDKALNPANYSPTLRSQACSTSGFQRRVSLALCCD